MHKDNYVDIIKLAPNNMDVELEYFYSLHPKFERCYNFTQSIRIKHQWFQSINFLDYIQM
jgi:hypothetical protein